MTREYKLEAVKGDKVIPVEIETGRESEHPNIIIRETQKKESSLANLLANPTASLKAKNK